MIGIYNDIEFYKAGGVGSRSYEGELVSFKSNSGTLLKSLLVEGAPSQELNGYDYPIPLGASINLLPYPYTSGTTTINGVTFTMSADGRVSLSGTASQNATYTLWYNIGSALTSGSQYYIYGNSRSHANTGIGYMINSDYDGLKYDNGYGLLFTYRGSSDDLLIGISVEAGTNTNGVTFRPMVTTYANRNLPYEPYQNYCPFNSYTYAYTRVGKNSTTTGSRYSRSLSPARYGFTYDFATGKLTTTHAVITLDSSLTWTKATPTSNVDNWVATIEGISSDTPSANSLSNWFRYDSGSSYKGWGYYYLSTSGQIRIETRSGQFADAAAFGEWLDAQNTNGQPVQLLYKLATPTINTYGTSSITLADGFTAVWSETGNVSVTVSDTTLKIKRPSDFNIQREDIYAGQYTTCVGSIKADRIGWRYSDTTIECDELTDDELIFLTGINSAVSFRFTDSDGEHDEQVIREGFANVPTRLTAPDGSVIWKKVKINIKFIDAHS